MRAKYEMHLCVAMVVVVAVVYGLFQLIRMPNKRLKYERFLFLFSERWQSCLLWINHDDNQCHLIMHVMRHDISVTCPCRRAVSGVTRPGSMPAISGQQLLPLHRATLVSLELCA